MTQDIHEILLKAHSEGVKAAVRLAMTTGVPLVVEKNGAIEEIHITEENIDPTIKSDSPS